MRLYGTPLINDLVPTVEKWKKHVPKSRVILFTIFTVIHFFKTSFSHYGRGEEVRVQNQQEESSLA
jgi:hypothetical protein